MSTERDPLYILGYQKGFASAAIKGQQAERERIVALLEAEEWDASEVAEPYVRHMVALIRGEES